MIDQTRLDDAFLDAVKAELESAREKFPLSIMCLAALTEEVGELAKACLDVRTGKGKPLEIWQEAVQVAAMAVRVATEGDLSINTVKQITAVIEEANT